MFTETAVRDDQWVVNYNYVEIRNINKHDTTKVSYPRVFLMSLDRINSATKCAT